MRLGLIHRPVPRLPRLAAVLAALPAPPEACNWHALIHLDGDPLGNDGHANCVECAALRALQMMRAAIAGDRRKPTAGEALALYRDWAGWDGTQASDIGTASDAAAEHWGRGGIAWGPWFEDIPAIGSFDAANTLHLKGAIATLGPVQLDLALPLAWQNAIVWSESGGPEGVPGSWGAHRVAAGRYDARFLYVVTWGEERAIPWDALARYALDACATATRSWLDAEGRSPGGLSYDALAARLAAVES